MNKAIVFDTETTGTDHEKDQVIEAAYIELPDSPDAFSAVRYPSTLPFYHERFKPSVPIQFGAQATHHILMSDLDGCLDSDQFAFPGDVDYLIGHNIDFDWRMIGQPDVKRIDTLALSRWLYPELDSHTQSAMIYFIANIYDRGEWARNILREAHSALADVHNCGILLRFLIQEINKRSDQASLNHWDVLWTISEHARIPTVMGFGKYKGDPIDRTLDPGYVRWYRAQADTDPYYLEAFKRAGF